MRALTLAAAGLLLGLTACTSAEPAPQDAAPPETTAAPRAGSEEDPSPEPATEAATDLAGTATSRVDDQDLDDQDLDDREVTDAAPAPVRVSHRTLPADNRWRMPGAAAFWWGPTGYTEVAQSVRLTEGMSLESLGIGIQRASVLPGWRTAAEEDISWNHEARWSGSTGDARIRISIWQGDAAGFGELVDITDLPLLTEQWVTMPLTIHDDREGANWLELDEPVELPAGDHLISLGVQSFGDPDVFNTYIWGRESGDRTAGGFHADVPLPEACGNYPRGEDLYPDGRIYYRVMDPPFGSREVDIAQHSTNEFRPHYAKILGPLPEGCSEDDWISDILNPGDLELHLHGTALD